MDDGSMTIEQACDYLQVKKGTLAQLRYTGKGPRYSAPTPKLIRYRREWIDEWLEASARTGTAAGAVAA